MNIDKKLSAVMEKLAGVNEIAEASKAMKWSLCEIAAATGMDAGWARINRTKGDINVFSETGEGLSSFCFPELKAPGCVCADAIEKNALPLSGAPSKSFCAKHGFKTVSFVPVSSDGVMAGFIFFASRGKKEPDTAVYAVMARHFGLMVSRIVHSSEMEKRLKTLQTATRVGAIISSQLTLRELTQAVVGHLGKVIRTDRVNLVRYHAKEQTLEFIATFISGEVKKSDEPEVYPLSDGMNSWIVKNRRPLLIKEDTEKECVKRGIRHGGKPAKSWLGVPMVHNGKIAGVLSVQSYSEPNLYDNASVEMLSLVAGQVAIAIENAQLYESTANREKEKQKLYYSLTHDLLSFVSPIVSYGEVLQRMSEKELYGKKEEIGKSLMKSAAKIEQFVEDILIFSKIQSGNLSLHTNAVNIYQIIDQSVSNFYSELNLRKLSLYIDGEKDVKASKQFPKKVVECDTMQIERVINNCLQNAVKHAMSRVEVSTRQEKGEVFCTIFDDGEGLSKNLIPKVFDEYYQLDHGKKGVGLGLPSVKRIVEQHGGEVWVETEKGKGFAFTFSLPVH